MTIDPSHFWSSISRVISSSWFNVEATFEKTIGYSSEANFKSREDETLYYL